uniref:Uncharacterized protein n=1 Tax=Globisporangium ultimum (strain ATCC 200006 / CBS 805.95 / DAOM BR144) TaxID=431595 RepID=K3WHE0_GLOUD
MDGTGNDDTRTMMQSPRSSCTRFLPSNETYALVARLVIGNSILSVALSWKSSGRNDNVCGQMGVNSIVGTDGCVMEPPADNEYAVEPVGVAMMIPSAAIFVISRPSQ